MNQQITALIGEKQELVNCSNTSKVEKKCKSCLATDFEKHDGSEVCTKCGQVFKDQIQFRNDPIQEYTVNCRDFTPKLTFQNNSRFHYNNRLPVAKREGQKTVEELASYFNLGTDLMNQALVKYKETSNNSIFHCTSKKSKIILAAICVYVTLINENRPVAIGHLCNQIQVSYKEFSKIYSQFIKYFPLIKPESVPIEKLVPVTLSGADFPENELKKLEERVIQIIELLKECWLIEGRSPIHVIYAATYLSWKSLQPNIRSKVSLTDFCKRFKIDYKHTTSERVTELVNALKTLASKIPTKKNLKITKTNIAIYIPEILEYQSSLIYDLNLHMKESRNGNDDQNPVNKSADWVNVFKRKVSENSTNNKQTNPTYITKDSVWNQKSDEEISDSEIDSYLRDKSEVRMIKKLKKLVQNEKEQIL